MITDIFSKTPDCEILTSRIVHFPIAKVFEAWSNPDLLQIWWGPKGFTNTFHEFDFRPQGKWLFTMHGPEVGHYENACEFIAIEALKLIAWKRHSKPLFNVVFNFEPLSENTTKIFFRMIFETADECNKLRPYVVDKNEENFDRLEKVLAS